MMRNLLGLKARWAARLGRHNGGSIAIVAALTLTLICGMVGLAIDVGMWYRTTRQMQNAADAAALAAARDGGDTYADTGKAVAARYGFIDGAGGVSVTVLEDQPCPGNSNNCYKALISDAAAPQFFTKVLGLGAPALSTTALAQPNNAPATRGYCMLALAESGANPAVLANGAPTTNLAHCNIMSNTGMTCHGHNLNADVGDAAGVNNGCGNTQNSHVPPVADPYASMASQRIPADPCRSIVPTPYRFHPGGGPAVPPPVNFGFSGTIVNGKTIVNDGWGATVPLVTAQVFVCGDLVLTGDTTIATPPGGTVVFIEDGTLDLNGNSLRTTLGSGVTFVFTGATGNSTSPTPYPISSRGGNFVLDFAAPTSGPWKGFALYIDPRTVGPQDITYAGNSPTWDITGLVYMPHAHMTFSGAVNKSANGADCFVLVIDSIRINGTGQILSNGGCGLAHVPVPTNTVPAASPALVL